MKTDGFCSLPVRASFLSIDHILVGSASHMDSEATESQVWRERICSCMEWWWARGDGLISVKATGVEKGLSGAGRWGVAGPGRGHL